MAERNLKYFMRERKEEIITVPGPETIKDENGEVLQLEIKVLSQEEIDNINSKYRNRAIAIDKKGNPYISNNEIVFKTERDNAKATRRIIVEALQYPNLKDKELMAFYKVVDVSEMPLKVFYKPEEYNYVTRTVLTALGIIEGEKKNDKVVEEIKN